MLKFIKFAIKEILKVPLYILLAIAIAGFFAYIDEIVNIDTLNDLEK